MVSINTLHQQAQALISQANYQQAHPLLVAILQQNPAHADSYFLLGIINLDLGQMRKAEQLMEKAITIAPSPEYHAHYAKCLALQGKMQQALTITERHCAEQINHGLTLDTFGVALSRIGRHDLALPYFEKAASLNNATASVHYNLGVSLKFIGDFSRAEQAFETAIAIAPEYAQAHFALADIGNTTAENNHLSRLQNAWKNHQQVDAGLHLGHALAKEYESIGDYSVAMQSLINAKQAKLKQLDYCVDDDKALFTAIKQAATTAAKATTAGCDNQEPIFILGMPRSGTTLVERILSHHSEVLSAGELQDFGVTLKTLTQTPGNKVLDIATLEAAYQLNPQAVGEHYIERTRSVTGSTPRFIDKLPFNFYYVDLIRRALPNAKIVCLMRDPMDTCIGNFRQLFSINSPYYHYAFDLLATGEFFTEFYRLAHFWAAQHRENFMLLNYEQLALNPKPMAKQLLAFCDLEWQPQCLHVEKNTAAVSTASKVQVRQPINTRSIGRWRKYQPMTEQLAQLLRDNYVPFNE